MAGMALLCSQKIYLVLSTPWASDEDHTWGAIYLALLSLFCLLLIYFRLRDGSVAYQDRLTKMDDAIGRATSKSPFSGSNED